MHCNLTVNTVQEALSNPVITADLERYIAKPERGKVAVNRVADNKQLLDFCREENRYNKQPRTYVIDEAPRLKELKLKRSLAVIFSVLCVHKANCVVLCHVISIVLPAIDML